MRSLTLLPGLALALDPNGPRVVMYQEQWGLYARKFSIWDLDDTVFSREMPYSQLFIMHAFLFANKTTCHLHTTDTWGDFEWNKYDPAEEGIAPNVDALCGRPAVPYKGHKGWFGIYNFYRDRYQESDKIYFLPSIGGWSLSHSFKTCTQKQPEEFLGNMIENTIVWNWDGLDLDWEYPSCSLKCGCNDEYVCTADKQGEDTRNEAADGDWKKYFTFLKYMRKALDETAATMGKEHLYSSMAIGMNTLHITGGDTDGNYLEPTPIEEMCEGTQMDFLNMMTYDYFGTWLKKTGPLAPLYDSAEAPDDDRFHIDLSVSLYVARCKNTSKLNMGLATYSKGWRKVPATGTPPGFWQESSETEAGKRDANVGWNVMAELDKVDISTFPAAPKTGSIPWYELVQFWLDNPDCTRYWASGPESPTLYCKTSTKTPEDVDVFISYEDPESWYYKMAYAKDHNMGGAIMWTSGDLGGFYQSEHISGGLDIGGPMWSAIFQGWNKDIAYGEVKPYKRRSDVFPTEWPNLRGTDYDDDSRNPICGEYDFTGCPCPLGVEFRVLNPENQLPQCGEKSITKTKIACPNCDVGDEFQFPPAASAGRSRSGASAVDHILAQRKTRSASACKRDPALAQPKDYRNPLKSYKQEEMGCAKDSGDGSGTGGGGEEDLQGQCTAKGCDWVCK